MTSQEPAADTGSSYRGAAIAHEWRRRTVTAMTDNELDPSTFQAVAPSTAPWVTVAAPTSGSIGFTTELREPTASLRRQCNAALKVAQAAMLADVVEPSRALARVLDGRSDGCGRVDRARVARFAFDLLGVVGTGTHSAHDRVTDATKSASPRTGSAPAGRGLFVIDRRGRLWAFRIHPSFRLDGVMDPWMLRLSAADGRVGTQTQQFAGVVIVTPRAEERGLHRTGSSTHPLGACAECASMLELTRAGS